MWVCIYIYIPHLISSQFISPLPGQKLAQSKHTHLNWVYTCGPFERERERIFEREKKIYVKFSRSSVHLRLSTWCQQVGYLCMYIYINVCVCMCVCMHAYIYIYIYIYIYTCMHTHMYRQMVHQICPFFFCCKALVGVFGRPEFKPPYWYLAFFSDGFKIWKRNWRK